MTGGSYVEIEAVLSLLGIFLIGHVLFPIDCHLEYTDLFLQVNASINVIMVIALKIPQVLITHLQNAKITVVVAVVAAKVAVAAAVTVKKILTADVLIATAILKRNMHGTTLKMGAVTNTLGRIDTVMGRFSRKDNGIT